MLAMTLACKSNTVRPPAGCPADRFRCRGGKLEQVDPEEALIIGDQLDLANCANEAFGGYAEITRRLDRPALGVVTKPAKKRGEAVSVAQNLNVFRLQLEVGVVPDGAFSSPFPPPPNGPFVGTA